MDYKIKSWKILLNILNSDKTLIASHLFCQFNINQEDILKLIFFSLKSPQLFKTK